MRYLKIYEPSTGWPLRQKWIFSADSENTTGLLTSHIANKCSLSWKYVFEFTLGRSSWLGAGAGWTWWARRRRKRRRGRRGRTPGGSLLGSFIPDIVVAFTFSLQRRAQLIWFVRTPGALVKRWHVDKLLVEFYCLMELWRLGSQNLYHFLREKQQKYISWICWDLDFLFSFQPGVHVLGGQETLRRWRCWRATKYSGGSSFSSCTTTEPDP